MRFGRSAAAVPLTAVAVLALACGGGDGPTGEPPIVNTQGTITGRVVDADSSNGGMGNVTVQATGTAGSKSATTASNGTFSISALEAGAYTVQLTAPGTFVNATGEVGTRSATVVAGQTATVTDFRLARPRGTVTGAVRASGAPIATTVSLTRTGFTTLQATSSGTTGIFTIANVPTGPWRASVGTTTTHELAAGESGTRDINVGAAATVDVTAFALAARPPAAPTINLTGTSFVPPTLTVAAGTTVRWVNDGGDHTITPESGNIFSRAVVSANGTVLEYRFASPGTYRYRCELHSASFTSGMVGTVIVQ